MMSDQTKEQPKVTIADTLYDAANDIRDYTADDGLEAYYGLAPEILRVIDEMDRLRIRIDAMRCPWISDEDTDRLLAEEREFRSQAQEETTQLNP
jgi:hypothetical protein